MRKFSTLLILGCLCLYLGALAGCGEKSNSEKAGDAMDKAADNAGDAMKDAGEALKDAGG